jgi:uncharacterized protein YndB with AHSA1/START domain
VIAIEATVREWYVVDVGDRPPVKLRRRQTVISAESTSTIAKPVAEVFAFVSDPANEHLWHTDVAEASMSTPGPLAMGSRIAYKFSLSGGGGKAVGEVIALEPGRMETIRFDHGPMGMRPTISFRFAPADGGARFTRSVEIEAMGLGRLLQPLMGPFVRRRNATFVNNLKQRLESGA